MSKLLHWFVFSFCRFSFQTKLLKYSSKKVESYAMAMFGEQDLNESRNFQLIKMLLLSFGLYHFQRTSFLIVDVSITS